MKKIIDKLKGWYDKPMIRNAVDAFIMQFMDQFLKPRGYHIVPVKQNSEPENNGVKEDAIS